MTCHARTAAIVLAASLALMPLFGCSSKASDQPGAQEGQAQEEASGAEAEAAEANDGVSQDGQQLANPFIDVETASQASELAGFEADFPESVQGYTTRSYQAVKYELAQAIYGNGSSSVYIRKGVGTDDVSGDYNDYGEVSEVSVRDVTVTEKGEAGLVYVATWTRDGYSFAIMAEDGLTPEVVEKLVTKTM